jgi:hypothetical protein
MTAIALYMSLCVRGAIKQLGASRAKKSYFTDADGQPLSRQSAIDHLMDELAKGHETIPTHKGCRNPCQNSTKCKATAMSRMHSTQRARKLASDDDAVVNQASGTIYGMGPVRLPSESKRKKK